MDTIFKKDPLIPPSYQFLFLSALILSGVYLTSFYNFLLFHTLAEIFSVIIACGVFVIVWNSRRFLYNRYLLFIGIAYFFVGFFDLLHTLSYKGMGVFPGYDANLPTQLWIIGRYMESLSLFVAPFFLGRELKLRHVFNGYLVVTVFLLGSVFYWQVFPDCFIEGAGLTPFKKISEYIISLILLASFVLLLKKESEFDKRVLRLVAASIFITIMSELAFTFYISVYGFSNLVGHFLKIISFYLIYKAVIETGFNKPYDLLFRSLKQSEIQAKEYLSIAGVMIVVIDADQKVSLINKKGCEILGCEENDILGKNWFDNFVPAGSRRKVKKIFNNIINGKIEPYEYIENILVTKNKEERIIAWNNTVVRDERGKIISTLSSGEDITERKRAEGELLLTQFSVEHSSDAAFWIEKDSSLVYVNEAACRSLGFTKEELLTKKIIDFDPNFDEKKWEKHWAKKKDNPVAEFETLHQKKDNTIFPVEIVTNYLVYEGKEYAFAYARDITERKKAEEELRKYEHIVSISSDFLSIIDRNYVCQAVNDTYCKTFNKKREDLIGFSVPDIVGESVFKNTIKPRMDQAFSGKKVQYQEWFDFPDPGYIYLDLVYNPYIGEDGKVKGIVFCGRDMTELQLSQEKIEKSLQEKELLLKEIHHRVKNNMQIISSLLTLQSSSIDDKRITEIFGQCQDRIKSMALVHEKLYQTEDFSMINFEEYVKTLTKSLFDSYKEGKNEINLEIDVKDIFLDIDTAIPLGLIINELVSNSLKHAFNKKQGGEIGVFLKKEDEENFMLKVWDNGIGFPETLDFKNTESLGLQLVTLLVEKQLKGEIDLHKNELTEFCVTFERKNASEKNK